MGAAFEHPTPNGTQAGRAASGPPLSSTIWIKTTTVFAAFVPAGDVYTERPVLSSSPD